MATQTAIGSSEQVYQLLNGAYDRDTGKTVWKLREYSAAKDTSGRVQYVSSFGTFHFRGIRKVPVRDSDGNASALYVVPRAGITSAHALVWSA